MAKHHALTTHAVLDEFSSSDSGLSADKAATRLSQYGPNSLPAPPHKSFLLIFLRQFLSPLIYVLLLAAVLSMSAGELLDAGFIFLVLFLNATIGAIQERSAEHSAAALKSMITATARVMRDAETYIVNSDQLVPGDIVLLESGDKVPADLRLLEAFNLRVDESLLSGESLPEQKNADAVLDENTLLSDRVNMAFSGTLVVSGRALGVVVATGLHTELGHIARDVLGSTHAKPPLLQRMEKFTFRLTGMMGFATIVFAAITLYQGMHWFEVFMLATALAVSAIPEGLPVAMTIALSVSIRRMAKRHVIARQLVTVEALGSCTLIASDKTGTLTRNEIVVQRIALPQQPAFDLPHTVLLEMPMQVKLHEIFNADILQQFKRLALAMTLTNEGLLAERNGEWVRHGDSIDTALLVMAHNLGISRGQALLDFPELASIPYESSARFSASLHGNVVQADN
ncbi:MAG: P-type Ca2+ transporter type, partial [Pseudomonadota bacterium]|nr:P-type Ca2+ transporter type [Pseudomonadota bacterium]